MAKIVEPAIKLAKDGVRINRLQDYIFTVVEKIYTSNEGCLSTYGAPDRPGKLAGEGDVLVFADLADTLDSLAREGEALFYRGEIAATLADDCLSGGGYLRRDDLEGYQVERRKPFEMSYGQCQNFDQSTAFHGRHSDRLRPDLACRSRSWWRKIWR